MNTAGTSASNCAKTVPLPRYVSREVTRHGREVYYYRPKKGPRYRLRAAPGTPEFQESIAAAQAGKPDQPKSFVYFALAGNKVKIGVSKDPRGRLGSIKTGSAAKVRIYYVTPGDRSKERELHDLFSEYRVNGEWFLYAQPIRDWIARDEAGRIGKPRHRISNAAPAVQRA